MSKRVEIILEDDIDGTTATETVSFGLDGASYEIDLNDEHATELRDALAKFIGAGQKVSGRSRSSRSTSSNRGASTSNGSEGPSPKEIREWAVANGRDVPMRGRVPEDVREAYFLAKNITDAPKAHGGGRKRRSTTVEEIEAEKANA